MSDYSDNGISFGKNKKINFSNFNGIHKDDLKAEKGALKDSLFAKYDKNKDNILDETELKFLQNDIQGFAKNEKLSNRETKKFFKSLGLENNKSLKRDDLYNFLSTIQADKDSIASASTSSESGTTFVEYKPDENNAIKREVYSNEQDGSHKPVAEQVLYDENHVLTTLYKEDGTIHKFDVRDNMQFLTVTNSDGKTKMLQEMNKDTNETVTTEFADDGETIASKYRENGAITEYLDPNNDRVTMRVTDKGNGVTEKVKYDYNEDGSYKTTLLDANDKPVSSVTKKGDKELATSSITTSEDGSTTEIVTSGEGENVQRTKVVKDKDGNVTTKVNIDENGNAVAYNHKVNEGENWYGIVQAKYGITDYKTTMEIVHQLKKNANVRRSSSVMPSEIELPPTVKLKNGQEIALKDIDAKFDELNSASAKVDVPQIPDDLPQAYPQDKLAEIEKNITIPQEYLEVKPENAGKTITQSDGKILEYNEDGKVLYVYNSEADLKANRPTVDLSYGTDYQINKYNEKGHKIGETYYNSNGNLEFFIVNEGIDPKTGNNDRAIMYKTNGKVDSLYKYQYNEDGNLTVCDLFRANDDGQFVFQDHTERKYNNDGTKTRVITYNAEGNLTEDKIYDM